MWLVWIRWVVGVRKPWGGKSIFSQGFSNFYRIDPCQCQWLIYCVRYRENSCRSGTERVRKHPWRVGGMGCGKCCLSVCYQFLSTTVSRGERMRLRKAGGCCVWKENSSQLSSSGVITKEAQIFPLSVACASFPRKLQSLLVMHDGVHSSSYAVCAVTQGNHALLTGFLDPFPF